MIWLTWHRQRRLLLLFGVLTAALCIWMYIVGHAFETQGGQRACALDTPQCSVVNGVFPYDRQAVVITLLTLLLPCVIGVVFGAPVVASELEHSTNRLVWTQGVSRTRWLLTKCVVVLAPLLGFIAILTLVAQWWSGHVFLEFYAETLFGVGRMQPFFFGMTGVVPIAYTLFAFALGAALGALIKKTAWAVVGTVVVFGLGTLVMVFAVRPNLAPQEVAQWAPRSSWDVGSGYRYTPGTVQPAGAPSASTVADTCFRTGTYQTYQHCLSSHDIQAGEFYISSTYYWNLQWEESAIYVAAAVVLAGATWWGVRRWRA